MQDLQNYQYYDPSPEPAAPQSDGGKRVFQLILAFGVVLIVIFISLVVFNVMKNRRLAQEKAELVAQINQVTNRLEAECDSDDAACLELAKADAARQLGVAEACHSLSGEALHNCVSLVATDTMNPEACDVLPQGEMEDCADTAYLLLARANLDVKLCESISDSGSRAACTTQVRAAGIAAGECAKVGVDEAKCDTAETLRLAIESGDPAECAALEPSQEYECAKAQSLADDDQDDFVASDETQYGTDPNSSDTDADGLIDGDEVKVYGTDPTNPDTDNDGFADGVEVDSGYDPLN